MVSELKQGWSHGREARHKPRGEVEGEREIDGSGRSSEDAEGQHNPGGAKDPWGGDVLDDAKADPIWPTRSRFNGRPPPRSEGEHEARIKLAGPGGGEGCA
jgi:hypothetical protein